MNSFKETQETPSTHVWYCLESKTVFQKSVVFLIILGIPATSRKTQWNFEHKKLYNFWFTRAVPKKLRNLRLQMRKGSFFEKIALGTSLQDWGYLGTVFCALVTLGASQKACLGNSIDMNLSLCAVKEDVRKMETFFPNFWTKFRQKLGVTINISLILAILLYSKFWKSYS